jgi:diguanylate cyclase (GGDEF)-like protein
VAQGSPYDHNMDGKISSHDSQVKVSQRHRFGERLSDILSHDTRRSLAAAEVLVAHWRGRVLTALVIAVLQLGLLHPVRVGTVVDRTVLGALGVVVGYVTLVSLIHIYVIRSRQAPAWLVTVALVTDLAFVFLGTITTTTPEHYERALFGTVVVVHVANFFFGRRQAWRVVEIGLASYVALIVGAAVRGLRIDVAEEMWTLVMCAGGIVLIVLQAGDVRRRLRTIVRLFEHAEQGDFSREYDVTADGRPDAITRVGQAYNRVRAQLASMVLTDPLTTCLNRRGFDQALTREIARATRAGSEFALLAIDLDHFKRVNDTYGHIAGDDLLRAVGTMLVQAGRAGDVIARVGGEEFAILLADTGLEGAQLFATRLCERIREQEFIISGTQEPLQITTSIGIAVGAPRGTSDFAEMLWSRADDALYAAKRANRDCVRAWTSDIKHSGQHIAIGSQRPA